MLQDKEKNKRKKKRHTFSDTRKRNDHGKHPRLNIIHSIDRIAQTYNETRKEGLSRH